MEQILLPIKKERVGMSEKVAERHLQKHLDRMYTEEEQEDIAFYPNKSDKEGYTWSFHIHGKKHALTYNFATKRVLSSK